MKDLFREFLDWVAHEARQAPEHDYDLPSRMKDCWEAWSATNDARALALQKAVKQVLDDSSAQLAFLEWFQAQPEFQSLRSTLALYQLVQFHGFEEWAALGEYKTLPDELKKRGVYSAFVPDGEPESTARINKLVTVLVPRAHDQLTSPQIDAGLRAVNFGTTKDPKTQDALKASVKAVQHLLEFRSCLFLLLFSKSLLIVRPFRVVRAISLRRRMRRILRESDCYALLAVSTGTPIIGESLGLAGALALLLGAIHTCLSDRKAYYQFINALMPRLSMCGFTGVIRANGTIEAVEQKGVEEKLAAMERHPDVRFAVLPTDNRDAALKNQTHALGLGGAKSLTQVLRWLMGSSLLNNLCLLIVLVFGLVLGILTGQDLYDDFVRSSPRLASIGTSDGAQFAPAYLHTQDLPVHRYAETINLFIANSDDDIHTKIEVRVSDRFDSGQSLQRLQYPDERMQDSSHIGDLHSSLNLDVKRGQATFVYHYQPDPCGGEARLDARDSLELVVWHRGRFVTRRASRYSLTLAVR